MKYLLVLFAITILATSCEKEIMGPDNIIFVYDTSGSDVTLSFNFHYTQFEKEKPDPTIWYTGHFLLFVTEDPSDYGYQPVDELLYRGPEGGNYYTNPNYEWYTLEYTYNSKEIKNEYLYFKARISLLVTSTSYKKVDIAYFKIKVY